ncbi:MAG: transaldolase [Candidatus Colwellbacteria bacterium]|nr:transaldolase [Candidatus Colwellbacteria bacterium]
MHTQGLKTKIFLDGGDPQETRRAIELLGSLDGQTTNPTLIAKNPEAQERVARGQGFSRAEVLGFYRKVVQEIAGLIPNGSVSVEVYADARTSADEMFEQGRDMFSWIPNAHIKFPITREGLRAAERTVQRGMRVNMTLCFTQAQAAAVYRATTGAAKGDVFISPFVGRLDDRGENGMNLVENILQMYRGGDGHVEVLAASIRSVEHLLAALQVGSDIATVPMQVLAAWREKGFAVPRHDSVYAHEKLQHIPYQDIDLSREWGSYNIAHELTTKGIERFSEDWNALVRRE